MALHLMLQLASVDCNNYINTNFMSFMTILIFCMNENLTISNTCSEGKLSYSL